MTTKPTDDEMIAHLENYAAMLCQIVPPDNNALVFALAIRDRLASLTPTKAPKSEDFLCGFMVCLSIVSERGVEVQASVREAWGAIGRPTIAKLRQSGVGDFDIETARNIRKRLR